MVSIIAIAIALVMQVLFSLHCQIWVLNQFIHGKINFSYRVTKSCLTCQFVTEMHELIEYLCNKHVIEDELHFILQCEKHSQKTTI